MSEAVDALLDSWSLDVFQCSQDDLKAAAFVIFERLGAFQNRLCTAACARNFIGEVAALYRRALRARRRRGSRSTSFRFL